MPTRLPLWVLTLCVLTLHAPTLAPSHAQTPRPSDAPTGKHPNIVLITGDHLGALHIGAHGQPHMRTPVLDRLVAEGTTFRRFYTAGVACMPNRASLFTGRWPHSHGVIQNGIPLPEEEITLTHVLAHAGYVTGQMGKLHFLPHDESVRNHRAPHPPFGFMEMRMSDEPGCYEDDYGRWLSAQGPEVREKARVGMPGTRTPLDYYTFAGEDRTTHAAWVAGETVDFIRRHAKGNRPFFVHAGFYAPHPPLNPPASRLALYDGVAFPPRKVKDGELDLLPPGYRETAKKFEKFTETDWTAYRKHFYAMVSELDRRVGEIVEALRAAGVLDRTLVVVTSDHGDYLGAHGLVGKSDFVYEEVMNIPLILRGPGMPAGKSSDALASVVDLTPTLLALAGGVAPPPGVQGVSLVPALSGKSVRGEVLMEGPRMRMVRTPEAKYAVYEGGDEVLFDLAKDPDEFRNSAADAAAKPLLDAMRQRLIGAWIGTADPLPAKIAPY